VDEKRVLNFENVVNDDDNIKQDMSIDVYGRVKEEDAEAAESQAAAALAQVSHCSHRFQNSMRSYVADIANVARKVGNTAGGLCRKVSFGFSRTSG
jgi:phosphoenolpyruvate carboxylase